MITASIKSRKLTKEQRDTLTELINGKLELRKKELAWFQRYVTLISNDIHNLKCVLDGRLPLRYLLVCYGNRYPTKKMA